MRGKLQILYQLSLADFRERKRRYSFLVTMIGATFFGYLVITGKYTIQFGQYKCIYNSAWAGTLMAVCCSIMVTIVGFYLVRGSIKRDRDTKVGQIIATTQMSGRIYITSKLISNTAALLLMVASLAVMAFATLLVKNEMNGISLWAFISPFIIICLPALIFVASISVLFETFRWLRGSAGNIIYLFLAETWVVLGMLTVPFLDIASIAVFTDSARAAAEMAYPGVRVGLIAGFVAFDPEMHFEVFKTFSWNGIDWTIAMLLMRLQWIVLAIAATGIATLAFDRFDPAKYKVKTTRRKIRKLLSSEVQENHLAPVQPGYSSLCQVEPKFRLAQMVAAELRLALKGYHWFWYMVAFGLMAAQGAAPFNIARQFLIPVSMVWPLIIWSSMGTRETSFNTDQLLFSSPSPLRRQLPAIWFSGFLIALAAVAVMAVRAGLAGQWPYVLTLVVAAFLVPSISLTMGVLSGGRKIFEVTYLVIWYIGSIDRLTALDILGTLEQSIMASKSLLLIIIAISSLIVTFLTRRRQMNMY